MTNVINLKATTSLTPAQAAWSRLKSSAKTTREDWRIVGTELLEARKRIASDKLFGQWCREMGFDMDRRVRADAMWFAESYDSTVQLLDSKTESGLCHPTAIRSAYNESIRTAVEPETDETDPSGHAEGMPVQDETTTPVTTNDNNDILFGKSMKNMSPQQIVEHLKKNNPIPVKEEKEYLMTEEQRSRDKLIGMKYKILGGMEMPDSTLEYAIQKSAEDLNTTVFSETFKARVINNLKEGSTKDDAFREAKRSIEEQLNTHIAKITEEFNQTILNMSDICTKLDKVDNSMLSIVFRETSNVNEAINAASLILKKVS